MNLGLFLKNRCFLTPISGIILALCFSASTSATRSFDLPLISIHDTANHINIDPFARYLCDTLGVFTPASIAALDEKQWASSPHLPFEGGYRRNPVWVRFSFAPAIDSGRIWYLSLMQPQLDTVELYQLEPQGLRLLGRTGRLSEKQWPAVSNRQPTFALSAAGNKTYFLRIKTTDVCSISMRLFEGGFYSRRLSGAEILYGMYFGAIATIAFFNICLFFAIRFRSCLWYSFWVLSFSLFQASAGGHWNLIAWMPHWFMQGSVSLLAGACMVSGGIFATQFLEIRTFSKWLWGVFLVFESIGVLLMAGSFFGNGTLAAMGASIFAGLFVLILLASGGIVIRHRGRTAVFFTVALGVLTTGILLNVFRNFGLLPDMFVTAQGNLVASVIEAAILAAALIDRISVIEKEKATEREKAQVSGRLVSESRLRALQAQINPHFLFNTLNTIAELTAAAPQKAEKMVMSLSRIIRYSLSASIRKDVTLAEEMEMTKTYLSIEKERFGDRLEYEFIIRDDLTTIATVGQILMPVVENAIKHGIGPLPAGGKVTIECRLESSKIYIRVHDTGCGFGHSTKTDGTRHGFANVEERLRLAYGDAASISRFNDNGAVVELTIPKQELV